MKKIFYILIIILFLNSCLVERTKFIKGVKSEGPVNAAKLVLSILPLISDNNNKYKKYTTTKKFVPTKALNAAKLVLSILPLFSDNNNKYKKYTTTKKFIPTNEKTSNPQIVEEKNTTTKEDNKKTKSYVKLSEW